MLRDPVNTAICLTSTGTYCISAGGSTGSTISFSNSATTYITGSGEDLTPYSVGVKIDITMGDNALVIGPTGLYVSGDELGFDVSFINEL